MERENFETTIARWTCSACHATPPEQATFCPACGEPLRRGAFRAIEASVATPAQPQPGAAPAAHTPTFIGDERLVLRPHRRLLTASCVAIGLALLVAAIAWFGADELEEPGAAEPAAAEIAATPAPEAPALVVTTAPIGGAGEGMVIRVDGEDLVAIRSVEGSRYADHDRRAESVRVRLAHVAAQQGGAGIGGFAARAGGGRYEVVWRRGEGDDGFRILDVTPADAEAWAAATGTLTTLAILANLYVDQLDAAFEREAALPQS